MNLIISDFHMLSSENFYLANNDDESIKVPGIPCENGPTQTSLGTSAGCWAWFSFFLFA